MSAVAKRHLIPLILVGFAISLSGCNTIGGAGKDLSSAGTAVTGAAKDVKDDMKN